MTLSINTIREMFKATSSDCPIVLLTITLPGEEVAVRVCSDAVETVSNGITYQPFPFRLTMPNADDGAVRARITLDNVSLALTRQVRSIPPGKTPSIACEIVMASAPDYVEAAPFSLELVEIAVDAMTIEGTLGAPDESRNPVPWKRFNKMYFPGL